MEEEKIICLCNEITEKEIVTAIKTQGLKNINEVSQITYAGTICGSCLSRINSILQKYGQDN